jgi:hypothetical protein
MSGSLYSMHQKDNYFRPRGVKRTASRRQKETSGRLSIEDREIGTLVDIRRTIIAVRKTSSGQENSGVQLITLEVISG